ncbi:MAG: hypothetical protein ACFFDM_04225 [Candidatus Thorarchaeota archaeon]
MEERGHPIHCDWCMIETKQGSKFRLFVTGANYCSRDCFYARNYEKSRNVGIFTLLFTIFFPFVVLAPYPGDIIPFLGYFTWFYFAFGVIILFFCYAEYRGRSVRMTRPERSRIGS